MKHAPASVWRNPIHFLAFGLGSGAVPKAPGTFGTLAAIPIWYLFADLSADYYLLLLVLSFALGCWLCGKTSEDLGVHDHGGIVWDEFVGLWITYLALPQGWGWVLIGFVLFRVFDILKPWPIGWADKRVSGGLGIMLDDVLAGIMALGCVQGLHYLMLI